MGGYYLVEGMADDEKVYFNSDRQLEPESKVFLNVSLETLNKRLGI
jgi:hypothetical protein